MSFVSITRLRVRSVRFVPGFAYYALRSTAQAKKAPGNLYTQALRERGLVFWTITIWTDPDAMRAFRNSGAHRVVMPKLSRWCDEATYAHWQQDSDVPPTLSQAYEHLRFDGIASKVDHPSPQHATREFSPPAN